MESTKTAKEVNISLVQLENDKYFKISNNDAMRPFFMSIVSSSNHWMFISSNGGLTAGRKNAEYSLFPYYTDDKITESAEITGSKTLFKVSKSGEIDLWEPFSNRYDGLFRISRNLYKNVYGNKVLFEEVNHDLQLTFQYSWNSSDEHGFVKTSKLINHGDTDLKVEILDGIQNVLPYGVGSFLQNQSSNLVDAYKRTELERNSGLGIFALSAIIVDKAEPSEALKANIAWSVGLESPKYLLSSLQLKNFRKGETLKEELDVKAEKGAYFVNGKIELAKEEMKEWMIVAEVNKNHSAIAKIIHNITATPSNVLIDQIKQDIEGCTKDLVALNAASDGLQLTADTFGDARHFSNTLFNIMRGGIFDNNYFIDRKDFSTYLVKANNEVATRNSEHIQALDPKFNLTQLKGLAIDNHDKDFCRLVLEYMPLKFSRRHGDPSRPWNKFSINTRSEVDGSKILDYEGNWRDIFQNWEAMVHSFPGFVESMIHKFLNATTFDGYNPYRVTKDGFDWETIEPDDPWSYIGYWGDHQIIYLLKLLECWENHAPGRMESYFDDALFVYANVPYKIKPYGDILKNPKDTIDFDEQADHAIRAERERIGADGALLKNKSGDIYQVNFIEKLLATVLAKLSNFIPEGGIWMNTQRPEWNDANNALVGNGVSMVTLYYLRRFLSFFQGVFAKTNLKEVSVSEELLTFYQGIAHTFKIHKDLLAGSISNKDKKTILDELGKAGSTYRWQIYNASFSGEKKSLPLEDLKEFVDLGLQYLEHSIQANKRSDELYHAYNLVTIESDTEVSISYLSEMLEGQVAVLSSKYLSAKGALAALDGMKNSKLFRPDQYSYLLYPNKELPGFLERNNIPSSAIAKSELLTNLANKGYIRIIEKDINGVYHFNGNFKNANDLSVALDQLAEQEEMSISTQEKKAALQIFEEVFNHKAFTGRSGTFYGYEGLGSIYWHMVSKLQLAVQEVCLKAIADGESAETVGRLLEHYYEINAGIGVHKPPQLYGAFPTDPYSHTPGGKGAQQPGMTGQVKEDILSRFGELGVFVKDGKLIFNPCLLRKEEFLETTKDFEYLDIDGQSHTITLEANSLCFTYCQIPIIYKLGSSGAIQLISKEGTVQQMDSSSLDNNTSRKIFERTGEISQIIVTVDKQLLR